MTLPFACGAFWQEWTEAVNHTNGTASQRELWLDLRLGGQVFADFPGVCDMLTQPYGRPRLVLLETRSDRACEECTGSGHQLIFDPETGHDLRDCPRCMGSGLNMLGLILSGALAPPPEGYGPTRLEKMDNHLKSIPYLESSHHSAR